MRLNENRHGKSDLGLLPLKERNDRAEENTIDDDSPEDSDSDGMMK